jgi:hypothetical protein
MEDGIVNVKHRGVLVPFIAVVIAALSFLRGNGQEAIRVLPTYLQAPTEPIPVPAINAYSSMPLPGQTLQPFTYDQGQSPANW